MDCLGGGEILETVHWLVDQKVSSSLLDSGVRVTSMDPGLLDDESVSCVEMMQTNTCVVDCGLMSSRWGAFGNAAWGDSRTSLS